MMVFFSTHRLVVLFLDDDLGVRLALADNLTLLYVQVRKVSPVDHTL